LSARSRASAPGGRPALGAKILSGARQPLARSDTNAHTKGWRLSAGEIERILKETIANLLAGERGSQVVSDVAAHACQALYQRLYFSEHAIDDGSEPSRVLSVPENSFFGPG